MCSCCVYMYLEQDSQVLEQLKMSISEITYFYIMYLCHSIYFTLPRGSSSPPLVHLEEMIPTSQYLYIISKCSSFQAFTLPAKKSIKTRGSGICPVTREPKRNFVMPGKKPRSRYSKKRRVSSAGRKDKKNPLEVK